MTFRIVVVIAACCLSLSAFTGMPTAVADPTATLPALTSGDGGPIIGGGSAAQQGIAQHLIDLGDPDIQQADGTDAANFITAAAAVTDQDLAGPFRLLHRALACQNDNAGFGARAYRRSDGQWGGAMLVAAKSTLSSVDALKQCVMTNWRRSSAGGEHAMCNNGWQTPTNGDLRKVETYYVLLAGTSADFCSDLNDKLKENGRGWP